jgi:phosphohistidine phosphatase SixA
MLRAFLVLALAVVPSTALAATAQDLVKALQGGGYVIVMRHASSPRTPPTAAEADPANPNHERQLDEAGRKSAAGMGAAIRALKIPIGDVWSSPTYRAQETIRLAGLPTPKTAPELGDGGQSMQAAGAAQGGWLKAKMAEAPRPGTDTLIVTHYPNVVAAFGQAAAGLGDGEAMVFHTGSEAPELVGRIRIEDWPALAGR